MSTQLSFNMVCFIPGEDWWHVANLFLVDLKHLTFASAFSVNTVWFLRKAIRLNWLIKVTGVILFTLVYHLISTQDTRSKYISMYSDVLLKYEIRFFVTGSGKTLTFDQLWKVRVCINEGNYDKSNCNFVIHDDPKQYLIYPHKIFWGGHIEWKKTQPI